ncbi:RES family NAD+ phosphorylase [Flavobacterium lipolyticum]|uniref:RES family NAD+ phosphorylase n=1 Tax=Flavobacterium lipolyticum TaxID=2893754 RepID=A0ABS8M6G9_9FLAO|nr:RES family NAD+ phosphorylase [Flavobacterium sp. F-126]MCC9020395.1 RES family NAD+ phosphorylase [Flavobacterium sp. F-126]
MNSDTSTEKYICYDCVGENHLKNIIKNTGSEIRCSYCENDGLEGFSLIDLANKIEIAFEHHFIQSPENPLENWPFYQFQNSGWENNGMPVIEAIMDAAEIEEEMAADVQEILADRHYDHSAAEMGESSEFESGSSYEIKGHDDFEWQMQWENFEHTLKTRTRFFNKNHEKLLKSIFEDIESLHTHKRKPVVRKIGPKNQLKYLFRARAFQSDKKLKFALEFPDKEIGPPPSEYATAGRMNSRGISVFYGSFNPETALAEIRPPVGCKVAVARFEIKRTLQVLDLSALKLTNIEGSYFDESYARRITNIMFLKKLSQRLTKPVMPDDEHAEYLATQVVAEFLASEFRIDGIIFPSAQSDGGLNVTLFHSASKVITPEVINGSSIEVSLMDWDGEELVHDYRVWVRMPSKPDSNKASQHFPLDLPGQEWGKNDTDLREGTLSIDLDSIRVSHIKSVKIKSVVYDVNHTEYKISSDEVEDK